MTWLWMNIPLTFLFFALWVGVPLRMVLKHRQDGPKPAAAQAARMARARRAERAERAEDAYRRVRYRELVPAAGR